MADIPKPFIPPPPAPTAAPAAWEEIPEPPLPWWRRACELVYQPREPTGFDLVDIAADGLRSSVKDALMFLLPVAAGLYAGALTVLAGDLLGNYFGSHHTFSSRLTPDSIFEFVCLPLSVMTGGTLLLTLWLFFWWFRVRHDDFDPFFWVPVTILVAGWSLVLPYWDDVPCAFLIMLLVTAALAFAAWAFAWFARRGVSGWQVLADPHKALQEASWEKRRELNAEDQPESLD